MDGAGAARALLFAALVAALAAASASDLARRVIPNACSATVAVTGALASAVAGGLGASLAGAATVLAVMLLAAAASVRARGEPGVGGGDVKLLAALGAWAGPVGGLAVVALSCALGSAWWLARRAAARASAAPGGVRAGASRGVAPARGEASREDAGIPLAPFAAVSGIGIVLVFSQVGGLNPPVA